MPMWDLLEDTFGFYEMFMGMLTGLDQRVTEKAGHSTPSYAQRKETEVTDTYAHGCLSGLVL